MRCVECLPLLEEYFDGEVEGRAAEQMRAHLSACEDCALALDALSFEQEAYARYDRGLEVTPALWARVSAEIAREPLPQNRIEERPFLSRVREGFAAALSTLNARPALASSLALLLVGVTAGSLWLSHVRDGLKPAAVVSTPSNGGERAEATDSNKARVEFSTATPSETPTQVASIGRGGAREAAAASTRETVTPTRAREGSLSEDELNRIIAAPTRDDGTVRIINVEPESHREDSPDVVKVNGPEVPVVTASAELRDSEDKEVARHVEQAQMLLRSIRNARRAEGDTVNVAYEKKLSRRLLNDNTTLQLEAETRGDKETKQVLDRIEPYLLDIANMHDDASREEVRSIGERIDRKEIIAALQVY